MRIVNGILFAILLALGCQKEPIDLENSQAQVFAIPDGQSARFQFYLLLYDGNSPIGGGEWGRLEPNAKFDLIETDESGQEIKTWAHKVAPDTFRVEGLELGRLYYFKAKAYLGRNYITQSSVVCLSAMPLPTPEVWIPPSALPFGGSASGVIAPNGQYGVFFQSIDTSSAIYLYEFGTGVIKPIPIQSPIKILWNDNSDHFLIHAYGPAINVGYGFSQLHLYDLPSDSLHVLTPEIDVIIISPHFTTAQDGVQFFTYDAAEKKAEMWRLAFDSPVRTAIYPQIIPYLKDINASLQFEISWDKAGENAFFAVNKDYNESEILHFNTIDNTVTPILADDNWPEFQASVSPNGKNLLFNTPRNGSTELWRYDRTTGQVSQISNSFSGINLYSYYGIQWLSDTEFYISGISATGIQYYKIKI